MNQNNSRIKTHEEVTAYIASLKDGTPGRRNQAREGLIKTGVLTKDGKRKKVIVSWE